MYKLNLEDKYEIQLDDENFETFKVLRFGEEWQDLIGNNFVLALVNRIRHLEECLDSVYEENAGSSI